MSEAISRARREGESLTTIRRWVHSNCGISFSGEQDGLFAERIHALCREVKLTVCGLREKIDAGDHKLTLKLAEAVSTNYTFFFREPEIFDYYMRVIVPGLSRAGELRVWSAASSSGDEAYSIAIASHEVLGDDALSRVRILGTDISERQLRCAELGLYPRDQTALLDGRRRARWFEQTSDAKLQVVTALKHMCTFRRLNLTMQPWPFTQRFQVIFLRNVLYYFEPPARKKILQGCHDALEPDGYLITSLTEPMLDVTSSLEMVRPAIYRRGQR
jgi:chemotaxis protein methyltransferase CheR